MANSLDLALYLIEILHQTTTFDRNIGFSKELYLIEILHQTTTFLLSFVIGIPLYLIEILHQTTTTRPEWSAGTGLYLIEILHQTTTVAEAGEQDSSLYLIEILHQTTTIVCYIPSAFCCILSKFYIKPQLHRATSGGQDVVSYRNSTSNHNLVGSVLIFVVLYLIEILHQTTTRCRPGLHHLQLYLIEILHQTTTLTVIT